MLQALTRHWSQYPPVHIAVAAYLGISKPESSARKSKPPDKKQQSEELDELLAMLSQG